MELGGGGGEGGGGGAGNSRRKWDPCGPAPTSAPLIGADRAVGTTAKHLLLLGASEREGGKWGQQTRGRDYVTASVNQHPSAHQLGRNSFGFHWIKLK